MKKIYYIFIFLLLPVLSLKGQSGTEEVDFQTWTDLTLNYRFNQSFSLGGDLGTRGIFSSKDWTMVYVRPRARYAFSQFFSAVGGVGYFQTYNEEIDNSSEFRLYQDFNLNWPDFGFVLIRHRVRFEQRFFSYESMESQSTYRGRYQIELESRDFDLLNSERPFYLNFMAEWFAPMNDSAEELFIHNARLNLGIGKRFSERFRMEAFYIWQKSRELEDEGFETSENVLRLRFFYQLNLLEEEDIRDDDSDL